MKSNVLGSNTRMKGSFQNTVKTPQNKSDEAYDDGDIYGLDCHKSKGSLFDANSDYNDIKADLNDVGKGSQDTFEEII